MSDSDRQLLLTTVLTALVCWALLEILEHTMGMAPRIVTLEQIHERARNDRVNPSGNLMVNKRLTKSFYGSYRMQTRGAICCIRFLWSGSLFVTALVIYLTGGGWFIDHFVGLKVSFVATCVRSFNICDVQMCFCGVL